uniref:Cytochrome P450 n=1 Tax=Kalanchoe fedtschenkoi TaxID=63787 RepID=A0A7N0TEU6_KALFE
MSSLDALISTPNCTLFILILLAFPLLFRLIRRPNRCPSRPPGPSKVPILGNLHQLDALLHQSLAKLATKYGPVMLVHFGREPTIVISSASAAKEALKTRDADFCGRAPNFCAARITYNYSDVTFAPYGEYWRQMRKTVTLELYSSKRVQSFGSARADEVNAMLESLALSATKGEVVDLGEKAFALTASIMFKIAFGTSFKGSMMDDKGFQKLIHEAEALLGTFAAGDYFGYAGWVFDKLSGLHSRLDRTFRRLDQFLEHVIDEHVKLHNAKDHDHGDVVDALLRVQREHVQSRATWFTRNKIKGNLIDVFLAGVDTSALVMIWTMTELMKNPSAMKKAQDEIREFMVGKKRISEQDTESLKYLKMVLKETLRMHPPAPLLIPKVTTADTRVFDYDIKAGTRVFVNAWAIGRDPKTWEQPEKFFPERFEESSIDYKGQNFELLPFGAGRRMCPGLNLGMATVELAVANMLYCFDWKLPQGMTKEDISTEEGPGVTTFKKIPLELVPVVKYYA